MGSCSYGKLCRYDHVKSSKNINKVKNEVQKQLNGTMFFSFFFFFVFRLCIAYIFLYKFISNEIYIFWLFSIGTLECSMFSQSFFYQLFRCYKVDFGHGKGSRLIHPTLIIAPHLCSPDLLKPCNVNESITLAMQTLIWTGSISIIGCCTIPLIFLTFVQAKTASATLVYSTNVSWIQATEFVPVSRVSSFSKA